jgi:hypothetical protein
VFKSIVAFFLKRRSIAMIKNWKSFCSTAFVWLLGQLVIFLEFALFESAGHVGNVNIPLFYVVQSALFLDFVASSSNFWKEFVSQQKIAANIILFVISMLNVLFKEFVVLSLPSYDFSLFVYTREILLVVNALFIIFMKRCGWRKKFFLVIGATIAVFLVTPT